MRKLTKLIFVTDRQTYRHPDESDVIGPFPTGVQNNDGKYENFCDRQTD